MEKFIDGKWSKLEADQRFTLSKTEAQCWLVVYNLSMDTTVQARYHMNSYRKNQVMRVRLGHIVWSF